MLETLNGKTLLKDRVKDDRRDHPNQLRNQGVPNQLRRHEPHRCAVHFGVSLTKIEVSIFPPT